MALSNIDPKHLNDLILNINKLDLDNDKIIKTIQRNSNNYSKLSVLLRQAAFIKQEIDEIIYESVRNDELNNISCRFKKIPGNYYFLYRKKENEELFFSLLNPEEWDFNKNNYFIDKYLYNYDYSLVKI